MKKQIFWSVVCAFFCVLSGLAGAISVTFIQEQRPGRKTLQVHRLELTDARDNVRAVFAVEESGSVVLCMLSRDKVPVIELGASEDRGGQLDNYTPSGRLIIRDGSGTPVIRLRAVGEGDGNLSFSTSNTPDQVTVGYEPYGDVTDGHDRAVWGVQVRGVNHESTGLGVSMEDGAVLGFMNPKQSSEKDLRKILVPPTLKLPAGGPGLSR